MPINLELFACRPVDVTLYSEQRALGTPPAWPTLPWNWWQVRLVIIMMMLMVMMMTTTKIVMMLRMRLLMMRMVFEEDDNDNTSINSISIESGFEILWLQQKWHWQLFMKSTLMLQSQNNWQLYSGNKSRWPCDESGERCCDQSLELISRNWFSQLQLLLRCWFVDFSWSIFLSAIATIYFVFFSAFKEFSRKGTSKNLFEKCTQSYKF